MASPRCRDRNEICGTRNDRRRSHAFSPAARSTVAVMVPLHVKSHYSIGLGTASVEQLIERAVRLGLPTIALTDVGNLYGQPLFHDLCRRAGIRPISGV